MNVLKKFFASKEKILPRPKMEVAANLAATEIDITFDGNGIGVIKYCGDVTGCGSCWHFIPKTFVVEEGGRYQHRMHVFLEDELMEISLKLYELKRKYPEGIKI